MKVPVITLEKTNSCYPQQNLRAADTNVKTFDNCSNIDDLSKMPYVYPVSFTSIQNSSKLRILFGYKLPCMYSGVTMVDPKQVTRMIKNQVFSRPASDVVKILAQYADSIDGMEAKVLYILNDRAKIHPDKNIQELLKEVEPVFRRRLRKKQAPIFKELTELAHDLPQKYQYKFKTLMENTDKKLNEKPIVIPFSSFEYRYKLTKIKEDILKGQDTKAKKVMNKLIKEAKKFSDSTNANTMENQKKVLAFQEIILRKSVLKNNEQLKNLIAISKSRLTKEEVIVPFSRKAFIYDLLRMLEDLPDKKLLADFFVTAQKLPTSQKSLSAYILKITAEQPEKIGYRILWPSMASVEHILPRSCGGADILGNFGGATTRTNSTRKNIPFKDQLKLHPEAKVNCQKYVDRLIVLYHQGVFQKHNINSRYIVDFKNTVYQQSNGTLDLDISKLMKRKE